MSLVGSLEACQRQGVEHFRSGVADGVELLCGCQAFPPGTLGCGAV